MAIYRKSLDKIVSLAQKTRILILLGSRQVGKTTLLKLYSEELKKTKVTTHYFILESMSDLELLSNGVQALKQSGKIKTGQKTVLLIDEFQYLQSPNKLFKEIYDTCPEVTIIASGSSSLEIQQKINESLAGRKLTLNIYPLDFFEYLEFKEPAAAKLLAEQNFDRCVSKQRPEIVVKLLSERFSEYVLWGGLPDIVLEDDTNIKQLKLQSIYETYIQKDIKGIIDNIEINKFNKLVILLNSQIGNLLNISEISNTLNISRRLTERYLEILNQTFVNYLLPPYSTNKRTEVTKTQKTYFYDNGVRNQILKLFSPLDMRADAGNLYENAIFLELKKNLPVSQELHFWRTKNKTEVDFILRYNENLYPIEVKKGATKSIPAALKSFCNQNNCQHAFIVNQSEWTQTKLNGVTYHAIPHFLTGFISRYVSE